MSGTASPRLRLAFMGTPDFAVPSLAALVAAGHDVAAVYCQPPRPGGRGHSVQPSPVQRFAEARGIAIRHPATLRAREESDAFAALRLDAAVVAAYGLILPAAILTAPRLGCLNIHASLLPRWRGAAPIQRAILAGDAETGITIMQMEEGLDTGPILLAESLPIGPRMTAASLHDALARLGARLVLEALARLAAGRLQARPQPREGVTYAAKLRRDEGRLDWRRPAAELERAVRAFDPWPGTFFEAAGERIKVLAADAVPPARAAAPGTVLDDRLAIACGAGALRPTLLQRAGRSPAPVEAFLRGFPLPPGTLLPCPATS
ncbi:MAG TPA: methionyl-tRNA formyltransferase [Stellaceae bacterium]|nr:methionyl-tRNA formyltransferase [Stellaceae bacterium]